MAAWFLAAVGAWAQAWGRFSAVHTTAALFSASHTAPSLPHVTHRALFTASHTPRPLCWPLDQVKVAGDESVGSGPFDALTAAIRQAGAEGAAVELTFRRPAAEEPGIDMEWRVMDIA